MQTPSTHRQARTQGVLSKAMMRAARSLDVTQRDVARVIGVSEATVSRLGQGREIDPDSKEGELAILFLRLYRSLDALVGGNEENARKWLHAHNLHLSGTPAELIRTAAGLVHVVEYLDGMRGKL